MPTLSFVLNGKPRTVEEGPDTALIWVLRERLGLTGTRIACGQGQCGCCTVLVDGQPRRSCVTPVQEVKDKRVTTIEGLPGDGGSPLLDAWMDEDVSQCGYCQPGMLMTAHALLKAKPAPSDEDVTEAMGGMLCRCGTYPRIRKAIRRASRGNR